MMAAVNFMRVIALIFGSEGGYVDHPADPGGATNHGVTLATLSDCRGRVCTKADVKALTKEEAAEIYRQKYWDAVRADELPSGVDYAVFDFGINSGTTRAIISLQRALGIADDGQIGPVTIAAAQKADPRRLIAAICDDRLRMMKSLKTWKVFGKGWGRRVAEVRLASLSMTAAPPTLVARLFGRSAG